AGLHNVFDLACDTGISALIEAVGCCGVENPAADLPGEGTLYHKAVWAWLNRPEAFERAVLIHQVEQLAWWRKRDSLPAKQPDTSAGALHQLGDELSRLLLEEQGRGKRCTVETFSRGTTDYLFAHPDDYVQNVTAHDDDGALAPRTFRRTFLLAFAY